MSTSINRLRVAVITHIPSPYQVDLFNAVEKLQEISLRVYYLHQQASHHSWNLSEGIDHEAVFLQNTKLYRNICLNPNAYRLVTSWKPDLVVLSQYASITLQLFMWMYSTLKKPWVFWSERPTIIGAIRNPVINQIGLRRLLRNLALFPVKKWPAAIWGIGSTACKIYTDLTEGQVPCENFPYHSNLTAFLSIQKSRTSRNVVRFLFSGNLAPWKGFDTLVDAVKLLSREVQNFEVYVVGEGEQKDLAITLPDFSRQHLHLLGFRQMNELAAIYADCDVLIFPSRYDGWGLSVVEAMAAGMPVIGSKNSGACVDLIEDNLTGFLIAPDNPVELCRRMLELIQRHNEIDHMGRIARRRAKLLDSTVGARRFLELSRSALQKG